MNSNLIFVFRKAAEKKSAIGFSYDSEYVKSDKHDSASDSDDDFDEPNEFGANYLTFLIRIFRS